MGTPNIRLKSSRNLKNLENKRQINQEKFDNSNEIDQRRKLGQFTTPLDLAKDIISYGLQLLEDTEINFLEPCIGSGAFYSALLHSIENKFFLKSATGIEIDSNLFRIAKDIWEDFDINILNQDFVLSDPDKKYNFVITNPPYIRHHHIAPDKKYYLANQAIKETGIELSGLSDFYCYFMLLTHKWLAPEAVCGWLVPSEFMDVNYGEKLKDYLLNNVQLIRIHRYDPHDSKFQDALVSSCVIWFKNSKSTSDYNVEFSFGGSHLKPEQTKKIRKSTLKTENKWTRFPSKEIRYTSKNTSTIGDFFNVKRGIATGDNKFFILDENDKNIINIPDKFLTPILPSPRFLKTDLILSDSHGLPQITKKQFLVNCRLSDDEIKQHYPRLWEYLELGLDKTSTKYLCRNRKFWYWQDKRDPTPFLCSYMGRSKNGGSPIRFILNHSKAIVTNSYLMLYPKKELQKQIEKDNEITFKIWDILKNIDGTNIEDEGRIYGGGLRKIEPKELTKVICPDILKL